MNTRRSSMLSVLFGLGLSQGACSLAVEADIPDVEITQRGVRFDGFPLGDRLGVLSTSRSFELSSSNTAWAKELNSEVRAMSVSVRAASGVSDLDFVKYAGVNMSDAAESAAPVQVMAYERADDAPSSSIIEVTMTEPVDVTALWTSTGARLEVQVAGELPTQSWTADITLRLSGKINYEY